MTTHVALLGHPVAHSLSPRMQNAAFAAARLDWHYSGFDVEDPVAAVAALRVLGFVGANVTIPHKQAVIALCDTLDDVALRAESVNTLVFDGGDVHGSSTDGAAVTDQIEANGRRALVLGAGGAAKAVAEALRQAGADVVVSTRRQPGWPPSGEGVEVLVNCTPLKDELVVTPGSGMQVVDLAYNADGSPTALVAAARAAGCDIVVDGLDVLLFQGVGSFERWTGEAAPIVAMRAALRTLWPGS
jgi:shikimate dehydrogenase